MKKTLSVLFALLMSCITASARPTIVPARH